MKKVLIVDDDPVLLNLVKATLEGGEAYQVLQSADGAKALSIVHAEKPDLIFLDIRMPGIDGYEVCRAIKANPETAHIVVTFLTALSQEVDKERGRTVGGDGYFTKPFSPLALLHKVEEVLKL